MIRETPDGVTIDVLVIPRARRTTVDGARGGALLVRLTAPPLDDAANRQLIDLLATVLSVPRRNVEIAGGQRQRRKTVRVTGIDKARVERAIAAALQRSGT
ncbi:MAG: DUF167 domain-containing protein [Vicinamibacterales bacterium]